jgi:hypothetical protein
VRRRRLTLICSGCWLCSLSDIFPDGYDKIRSDSVGRLVDDGEGGYFMRLLKRDGGFSAGPYFSAGGSWRKPRWN